MRFFTREWSVGEVDDVAAERIAGQYADHLADLWDRLPSPVRQFVDEVNLHDALVRSVDFDADRRALVLMLRGGDEDDGHFDATLRYRGAEIAAADLDLLISAQSDPAREILSDELDADGAGRLIHRLLLAPDGEIEITFESLRSVRTPVSSREA